MLKKPQAKACLLFDSATRAGYHAAFAPLLIKALFYLHLFGKFMPLGMGEKIIGLKETVFSTDR